MESSDNISKLEELNLALQSAEEKLRTILEHSTNLFYAHDTNHVLYYVSPQSEAFFGVKPEDAMKKWTTFATDNPINKKGLLYTEAAIRTGKVQAPYELELYGKGGKKIWVQVNESPIIKDGKTVAIVGSLTDITEQKNAMGKLEARNAELEKLNKLMIGRENIMVNMKKEISDLKNQLSKRK